MLPVSASAAEDMTFLIVLHKMSLGPLIHNTIMHSETWEDL